MTPVLLPVLKGLHADTHEVREFRLREAGSFPNRSYPVAQALLPAGSRLISTLFGLGVAPSAGNAEMSLGAADSECRATSGQYEVSISFTFDYPPLADSPVSRTPFRCFGGVGFSLRRISILPPVGPDGTRQTAVSRLIGLCQFSSPLVARSAMLTGKIASPTKSPRDGRAEA